MKSGGGQIATASDTPLKSKTLQNCFKNYNIITGLAFSNLHGFIVYPTKMFSFSICVAVLSL